MPEREKTTLQLRCPKCRQLNIFQREDFKGRARILFKCAKCGYEEEIDNPDVSE